MRKWLLPLLVLLLPGVAVAQTTCITASTTGTFSMPAGVAAGTMTWDCGTPTGDDTLEVNDSDVLTIDGDVDFDGVAVTGSLTTTSATATLEVIVTETTGPIHLDLNAAPGWLGTQIYRGAYREYGSDCSDDCDVRATPNPLATFTAGTIINCPVDSGSVVEPDCNAGSDAEDIRRIEYTDAEHNVAEGHPGDIFLDEAITDLTTDDILKYWDPETTDLTVFPEVNTSYNISAIQNTDPYQIDYNITRGTLDQVSWPLARRGMVQALLVNAAGGGDREFCISDTASAIAVLDADEVALGRWLRFRLPAEDCPGEAGFVSDVTRCVAEPTAFKISALDIDSTSCGANEHLVTIGDPRGITNPHAAGETIWIDDGANEGDPFFVMSPVRVTKAIPTADTQINFAPGAGASSEFTATELEGRYLVGTGTTLIAPTQDIWSRDGTFGANAGLTTYSSHVVLNSDTFPGGLVERVDISGGSDASVCDGGAAACDGGHGISIAGSDVVTIQDSLIWHLNDDAMLSNDGSNRANWFRIRATMRGDNTSSQNFLDQAGTLGGRSVLLDGICEFCGSAVAVSAPFKLDRFVQWGGNQGMNDVVGTASAGLFSDLVSIGQSGSVGVGLPSALDGCYIGPAGSTVGGLASNEGGSIKDCWFDGIEVQSIQYFTQIGASAQPMLLENILCTNCTGNNGTPNNRRFWMEQEDPPDITMRRVTIAYTDSYLDAGGTTFGQIVRRGSNITTLGRTMDGLLVSRCEDCTAVVESQTSVKVDDHDWVNGLCLYRNNADAVAAAWEDNFPLEGTSQFCTDCATIRGLYPGYIDPEALDFRVVDGSPADQNKCGIDSASPPGVGAIWGLALARMPVLKPGFVEAAGGGGGGGRGPLAY